MDLTVYYNMYNLFQILLVGILLSCLREVVLQNVVKYGYRMGTHTEYTGIEVFNKPSHHGCKTQSHWTTLFELIYPSNFHMYTAVPVSTRVKCADGPAGRWEWLKRTTTECHTVKGHWVVYEHPNDGVCETVFLIRAIDYNKIYDSCKNLMQYEKVVAGNTDSQAYNFVIKECYLLDFRGTFKFTENGNVRCPERIS